MEKRSHAFYFTPISNWNDGTEAFEFALEKQSDAWIANTAVNKDLIDQAIEEIEHSYNFS